MDGYLCNKWKVIVDGEEVCMSCDINREHDLAVAERLKALERARPVTQLLNHFQTFSLMNEDLKTKTLNGYKPENASEQRAKNFSARLVKDFDGRQGLFLYGRSGTGKSHLAAGISKGVISQHGKTSIFISLPRLLRELRNSYGEGRKLSEGQILDAMERVDLLVIDDIGAERIGPEDEGKAWAITKVNEIVDFRAGKATVFTSNYDMNELLKMYGERDFSRMIQYAEPVEVVGRNRRIERFEK